MGEIVVDRSDVGTDRLVNPPVNLRIDSHRPDERLHPEAFTEVIWGSDWQFKQTDDQDPDAWMSVRKVPSDVHQDLIDNGKLEDPFVGFNEIKAEWVGTKSWTYRTRFDSTLLPSLSSRMVFLVFEGLDTYATVKLDGQIIHQNHNMFVSSRHDITRLINAQQNHELEIIFEPALIKAREIQDSYEGHKFLCWNGESSRLVARKAQYHWGWDWGPFLMCCGIWRPVKLEVYDAKVQDLSIRSVLSDDLSAAMIDIKCKVDCRRESILDRCSVDVQIRHGNEVVFEQCGVQTQLVTDKALRCSIDKPKLWMPYGYGGQNLYTVHASLKHESGGIIHHTSKRFGLRKVELVQEKDAHGKSFYFRVNNVDIFCGGSCWIPADSFLPNITKERYRAWLELMVAGNQKMIRVWGGGIYEEDIFYDICDELGVLVWQDFMFGCGNYPARQDIRLSIEEEAEQNLKRIKHHPCLAIFAGNNEDYQLQESEGLTYNYEDKDEANWLKTDFPARYIYESLLPRIAARECPEVPYHPGSPWGDGKLTTDKTVGDIHQWNVWHGSQEKYQIFETLGGRFNSEFGMEAFPHLATVQTFVEKPEDLYPQSRALDHHNKAQGHERRLATYLAENVRSVTDLEGHIHLTQLIQCEALMFAYRGWRRQWGDGRKCGGALVWQLNDCWPATSWAICDYYLRRKPAYYAMSRVLTPIAVGVQRKHYDWSEAHARQPSTSGWQLWAVSSSLVETEATVEVRFISVATGKEIKDRYVASDIKLTPNGTTEIGHGTIDNVREEPHVLAARLWVQGELTARDMDWPQPLKYMPFPSRNVQVKMDGDKMHVSVDRPVKCFVFEEREGCHLSDSALDIAPGDDQVVTVRGLKVGAEPLSWTYLGAEEQ